MKHILPFALLAAVCGQPALASQDVATRVSLVRYSDFDLSTADGRAKLDRRIRNAVRRACDSGEPRRASDIAAITACEERAWNDAARQIEVAAANLPGTPGKRYSR